MSYHLTPFTSAHLDPAVALFIEGYRQEREHSPLLPTRTIDDPTWIRSRLAACLNNPSVAVVHNDRLAAYMVTGAQFHWKGQAVVFGASASRRICTSRCATSITPFNQVLSLLDNLPRTKTIGSR